MNWKVCLTLCRFTLSKIAALRMSTTSSAADTTAISEGSPVPDITWKTRTRIESSDENPFDWKDLSTNDLFKGKR